MDMRQYASKYIKPDNVRDGPIQTRVVNVFEEERYGRPALELENGSQFTLNEGNNNTLIKAWGHKSKDWLGQELELFLDTYKDWRADPPVDKETVKVRALSSGTSAAQNGGVPAVSKPLPASRTAPGGAGSLRGALDDDILFAPEWR